MAAAKWTSRLTPKIASAIIVVAILLIYWPTLGFGFLNWDDGETLARNPLFNPPTIDTAVHYWQAPHMSLYVPVTYTVWTAVGGVFYGDNRLDPLGFRLLSLLLHCGSSLLVFQLIRRLLRGATLAALAGGLLFALHPVQVEPVCWISGGKDLLAGFFSFACCLLALFWFDRKRAVWLIGSMVFAALAMLAKPAAATLPLIVVALSIFAPPAQRRRALWFGLALLALAAPVVFIAHRVQPASELPVIAWWQRGEVAGFSIAFYLLKLIWPARLAVSYGWEVSKVSAAGISHLIWIVPVAIAIGLACAARRATVLVCATAIFLFAALPVLGFLPFEFQAQSTVADHYLYTAMLGVALAAAWVIARWPRAAVPAFVLLVALGVRSFVAVWVWQNDLTLFSNVLSSDPTNLSANRTLGIIAAQNNQPDVAAAYYDRTLATHPNDRPTLVNYGNLNLTHSRPGDADRFYARAEAAGDHSVTLYNNWGVAAAKIGDLNGAMRHFIQASDSDANSADAWANQGLLQERAGKEIEARALFSRALAINPNHKIALAGMRQLDEQAP